MIGFRNTYPGCQGFIFSFHPKNLGESRATEAPRRKNKPPVTRTSKNGKMLPLDYPPCWEFPLRKNKMHSRGCASNVKERTKNLRH